jgi:hypothetical protein
MNVQVEILGAMEQQTKKYEDEVVGWAIYR